MSRKALDWPCRPRLLLQKHDRLSRSPSNNCYSPPLKKRRFSNYVGGLAAPHSLQRRDEYPLDHASEFHTGLGYRAREKLAHKDFFFSLLSSASTKREAKSYLSRFKAPKQATPAKQQQQQQQPPQQRQHQHHEPQQQTAAKQKLQVNSAHSGVNLGGIFGVSRAVEESPVFRQESNPATSQVIDVSQEKLHVALVKLKEPQLLDDQTLQGIARTLSQLSTLGMGCCVVVDTGLSQTDPSWRQSATEQAERLSAIIDAMNGPGSRQLDSNISLPSASDATLSVVSRNALLSPLSRGRILVIVPIGYTDDTQRAVSLSPDDLVFTLAKEFAGLNVHSTLDESSEETAQRVNDLQGKVSLDKVIILDPVGGIPALKQRPQISHVFVNMEQEYGDIVQELSDGIAKAAPMVKNGEDSLSALGKSNPMSKFVEMEVVSLPQEIQSTREGGRTARELQTHLNNIKLLQRSLAILPPASSGLITTPHDAANSAKAPRDPSQWSAVRTRRQRNPLIHNLLTDKPVHSPSLPVGRLRGPDDNTPVTHPTFLKKGMPLVLLPDPRIRTWTAANDGMSRLTLNDPQIDLARLVHLIEDSFNRKLDVQHYLNRVNSRLAGLIIAGEYEGGAVLTWETPPGVPDDGSPESLSRMVPYLDKFAVLKRSQGAGGVADIVFNAMVRTCFPKGVCWRSRQNNPVNKWYFERARGTWKLPETQWAMFWTTDGVPEDGEMFWDYEGVCRSIEPSWADNKHILD
ncbi:hypothetical protein AJ80_09599 [Polytolypa hystricis UAMH7299]|uniref:Amino-acid acetyltransferase, mitochondrial n=1 Tax=Polytolypa hystricis (strain UAMH7299) TaxID=1447883 RepID=A0A2B7WNC8_POLH7|nr:hypothetical protein AJ80_09599 [Polytolypa hystricis UAMH7299]